MRRGIVAPVVAVAASLALPARAQAIDHVVLFVSPTKLTASSTTKAHRNNPKPNRLAAWKLSAAVVGSTSPGGKEIFGVSLTRSFMNGQAEELHAFRAAPPHTVTFDGRSGRWEARFGSLLTVGMTITATGAPQAIGESQGCRGDLARDLWNCAARWPFGPARSSSGRFDTLI